MDDATEGVIAWSAIDYLLVFLAGTVVWMLFRKYFLRVCRSSFPLTVGVSHIFACGVSLIRVCKQAQQNYLFLENYLQHDKDRPNMRRISGRSAQYSSKSSWHAKFPMIQCPWETFMKMGRMTPTALRIVWRIRRELASPHVSCPLVCMMSGRMCAVATKRNVPPAVRAWKRAYHTREEHDECKSVHVKSEETEVHSIVRRKRPRLAMSG